MPSYVTHRAAGERVLKELNNEAIQYTGAFYLGCQGPDILYFNWPSVRSGLPLGLEMHNKKTRELVYHAMEYLKNYDKPDKEELTSYLAGFLTHYAIDKSSHPFIYRKSHGNVGMHHAMEYLWDGYTSIEEWNIEPQSLDIFSDIVYGELGDGITSWYSAAARDVYSIKLKKDSTERAIVNFAKSKKNMFADPCLKDRMFFWITSGLKTKKMLKSQKYDESIFSKEEYGIMQKLITKGVSEACRLIDFMLDYIDGQCIKLPPWLIDKNFSGTIIPLDEDEPEYSDKLYSYSK